MPPILLGDESHNLRALINFFPPQYIVNLMDTYGGGMGVLWVAIFEMAAIMWVYGVGRFASDLKFMLERNVRDDVHMTSALTRGEGVSQFLTKGREVAWIWY